MCFQTGILNVLNIGMEWFLKPHAFFHVQLKGFISNRSRNITKIENRINEIVERIHKYFSKLVGVTKIHEYEETQLREAQEISERRLKMSNQMEKLKYQYVF